MILEQAHKMGVNCKLKNGRDVFVTPSANVTKEVREFIAKNKSRLIEELRTRKTRTTIGPFTEDIKPAGDRCIVTFSIGDNMQEIAKITLPRMERYAERCQADLVVIEDDQCPDWPIGNKLRFGGIAQHYERSLLLDLDIWINPRAPNIFTSHDDDKVWMHSDVHHVNEHGFMYLTSELHAMAKEYGLQLIHRPTDFVAPCYWQHEVKPVSPLCLNSGVILLSRYHAERWTLPEEMEISHTAEQAWVELMLSNQFFINLLDSTWNWITFAKQFRNRMFKMNFVHLLFMSQKERLEHLSQLVEYDKQFPWRKENGPVLC